MENTKAKVQSIEFRKDKDGHRHRTLYWAIVQLSDGSEHVLSIRVDNYAKGGRWVATRGSRSRAGATREDAVANFFA